ncbi:FAD-dependent oxidoreductase [Phragmitibacter flavus]|uniref:FAD-dependent oxidoreductase n=1 Tax=Phragmitibacter flavus TaxID=2576071 RepID=A0A5R8KJA8_9BACT|nr:FAD-dependent oxidoreductase [Phragmitibacter flavus]TLD72337.1 FAD-dependent oxidoreductase [Phragmitibacter flavus]
MRRFLLLLPFLTAYSLTAATPVVVDVCVYGATPAGITAAIAAKQEGASVILIEPSRWVGGILGAGIKTKQDCPEPRAVGGLTQSKIFTFANFPSLLRRDFEQWLTDEKIDLIREHRIQSATKDGTKITSITLEHAPPDHEGIPIPQALPGSEEKTITATIFIDASYEGDLMAKSGVTYSTGREASSEFNEQPAGVGPPTNWTPIDPYLSPGDPTSGLVPLVDPDHGKPLGSGDDYTQAYNFRFYTTNDPANRAEFGVPTNYTRAQFELVGRFIEHLKKQHADDPKKLTERLRAIFPGWMNSGEYNYQRNSLITMAPLGLSRYYQDGDYAKKSEIWRAHRDYLAGLHHFMSTDPRVPETFRNQTAQLGLKRDTHPDTNGWPHQLYVRITRRMHAPYQLTHADVLNQTNEPDSVGLALYGVDTYPARRYVAKHPETGQIGVATEGNMFIGGAKGTGTPYPVPYRSITPKPEQCTNLLVPVCFSATHIAYASARMEPVFAVLGESAGVAAAQSVKESKPVQSIDIATLQKRLLQRGQVLEWKKSQ